MTTNATLKKRFLLLAVSGRRSGPDTPWTFKHDVPRSLFATASLIALILMCCSSSALGQKSSAEQLEKARTYSGRWAAESSEPDRITRLEIASNSSVVVVQMWTTCEKGECYSGSREIETSTADAGELSVTFSSPSRIEELRITLLPDRRLQVARHITYADTHRSRNDTQEFKWLSRMWGETIMANVPERAWPVVSSSVVAFFAKQATGQLTPVGSGLLVKHNLVATSYNLVKNATQLQARLAAQSAQWPVLEVVKVDEAHDVALVRVDGLRGWPLSIYDSRELAVEDELFVITNATDGTIAQVTVSKVKIVNGIPHIEITTPLSPIESGLPVFTRFGRLVGLAASNPEGAKKRGLVIPGRHLTALMPDLAALPDDLRAEQTKAVDSRPVMIQNFEPLYTEEARRKGISGKVRLRVLVGADGEVKAIRVISALPYGLDQQAIQSVFKSRFKPAMKNGQPVVYWLPVEIDFQQRAAQSIDPVNPPTSGGIVGTTVDSRPVALDVPAPRYTEEARRKRVTGEVKMRVLVGADGKVTQVNIISGLPCGLSEQAAEAARKVRFKPAMKAGQPVAWWLTMTVGFDLR